MYLTNRRTEVNFIKNIGLLELSFISAFFILYLGYLIRIYFISKKIKTNFISTAIKGFLRLFYCALLVIAVLGPHTKNSNSKQDVKSVSKDIFIALDLSLSMNATDIPPSRLERVKFELTKVINNFSSDKIGLIIFSSNAYMQCPLTFDKKSLSLFLDVSSTGLISNNGTDFYHPLNMALTKHLSNEESKESAKIILLISDGEDFSDKTEEIAEEIKDKKIKLFTLGVGTKRGSTIPNPSGKGVKKDNDGKDVLSTLNNTSLKKLAKLTGGQYFEISDTRNDTQKLINSINKIKGEVKDIHKTTDAKALRYQYFLLPALLLMLLDFIFVIRVIKL